jgi:hypothetical protein
MFHWPTINRFACCLAACSLALLLSPAAHGQIIDLSLNVYYDIPSDINSGGTWKLVGKSTHDGIAGLQVDFSGINPTIVNEAPRGIVNGSDPAGFVLNNLPTGVSIAQFPVFPTSGEVESAFYDVGTVQNGEPSPALFPSGSLTNPQDIPWATGDDLVEGASPWDIAATFLSGTFADNSQPAFDFSSDITGRVFTSVGSSMTYGVVSQATVNTEVRTNFVATPGGADYNEDGFIDAADYVLWRKVPDAFGGDPAGYLAWKQQFGETVPGAGGSQSTGGVPEPASALLLVTALFCRPGTRSRQRQPSLAR